jgi:hypothetical protein
LHPAVVKGFPFSSDLFEHDEQKVRFSKPEAIGCWNGDKDFICQERLFQQYCAALVNVIGNGHDLQLPA